LNFVPVLTGLSVFSETDKIGSVRFSDLCRFFNPCVELGWEVRWAEVVVVRLAALNVVMTKEGGSTYEEVRRKVAMLEQSRMTT
jgi:hypothetical protein